MQVCKLPLEASPPPTWVHLLQPPRHHWPTVAAAGPFQFCAGHASRAHGSAAARAGHERGASEGPPCPPLRAHRAHRALALALTVTPLQPPRQAPSPATFSLSSPARCPLLQFTVMESFFKGAELAAMVRGVEAVAFRSWGVTTAAEADASKPPVFALERAADPLDPGARGGEQQQGGTHASQTNRPANKPAGSLAGIDTIFLELMDHERVLPYVVDSLGWNIHMRDALFTPQKPFGGRGDSAGAADPSKLSAAWHFDQEEELTGVTQDGLLPLVDFKVSYYLSDHTEPGHACTMLVPGSHRWTPQQRSTWEDWLDPADVIPLRVPIGTVLLWRSSLLHAVSPHLSASPRYHLYFSFVPRWVRPSFRGVFSTEVEPDPTGNTELLERCSPIQRQL